MIEHGLFTIHGRGFCLRVRPEYQVADQWGLVDRYEYMMGKYKKNRSTEWDVAYAYINHNKQVFYYFNDEEIAFDFWSRFGYDKI